MFDTVENTIAVLRAHDYIADVGLATGLFIFAFMLIFEWRRGMTSREYLRLGLAAGILAVGTSALVTWAFESLFLVTLP